MTSASEELRQKMIDEFNRKKGVKPPPSAKPDPVIEIDTIDESEGDSLRKYTGDTGSYPDVFFIKNSPEAFPEHMRKHIPSEEEIFAYTGQFFQFAQAQEFGMVTALVGPPGSGKDTIPKQYASIKRVPYYRLTGMRGITPDVIFGRPDIQDGSMGYIEGNIIDVARYGGVYVVSEIAAMPSDTVFALQSAMEQPGYLTVPDHPDPEMRFFPLHPDARIVITSNVRGYGDSTDRYSATGVMDASTLNRIEAMIEVPYMDLATEVKLILRKFDLPEELVIKMVKFSNLLRTAWDKEEISPSWSLRNMWPWCKWAKLTGDVAYGFHATFFNKLAGDVEKEKVRQLWTDVKFGKAL